jgi:hypothetical protein
VRIVSASWANQLVNNTNIGIKNFSLRSQLTLRFAVSAGSGEEGLHCGDPAVPIVSKRSAKNPTPAHYSSFIHLLQSNLTFLWSARCADPDHPKACVKAA